MIQPNTYANNSRAEGNKGLINKVYICDTYDGALNVAQEIRNQERNGTVRVYQRNIRADNRLIILYAVVARYPSLKRRESP